MTSKRIAPGLLAILLMPVAAGASETELRERVGYAYDPEDGRLVYTETHNELFRGDEVIADMVVYRDAEGAPFAEKRVDFTEHLTMPDFHLTNVYNGHVESAVKDSDSIEVEFRKLHEEEMERKVLELPDEGIVDAGFDRFIEEHWDALRDGETLVRDFLVPSRLDFYPFRIRRAVSREGDGEMALVMEVDSLFVRMFVPPVVVSYDADTRRLRRYQGVSNIRNDQGENHSVRIEFPRSSADPAGERARARVTRVSHEKRGANDARARPVP